MTPLRLLLLTLLLLCSGCTALNDAAGAAGRGVRVVVEGAKSAWGSASRGFKSGPSRRYDSTARRADERENNADERKDEQAEGQARPSRKEYY